jgi:hypothetical protein
VYGNAQPVDDLEQVDLRRLRFDGHAIERAQERLWPGLSHAQVKYQLRELLVEHGQVQADPPAWYERNADDPPYCYVVVGDMLAVAVRGMQRGYVAITVLTPGTMTPQQRERRNKRQAERRASRKARNRKSHHQHRVKRPDYREDYA